MDSSSLFLDSNTSFHPSCIVIDDSGCQEYNISQRVFDQEQLKSNTKRFKQTKQQNENEIYCIQESITYQTNTTNN